MTSHTKLKFPNVHNKSLYLFKTFSASLGTGLFLDKVLPDLTMSTFQTHTGSAFRVAQRRISHINQKRGGWGERKGPRLVRVVLQELWTESNGVYAFFLLPPLAERKGSPLSTFLHLSSLACGLRNCSCNKKAVVVARIVQHYKRGHEIS